MYKLSFDFHVILGRRETARFDAPAISSNGVGLLLLEMDKKLGVIEMFAPCFDDCHHPRFTIHPMRTLLFQRIVGIALGCEDLNDHEQLRYYPLMAVLAGKPPAEDIGFDFASGAR